MKRPPEMSASQFRAALARNGFSGPIMFWFQDTTGQTPGVSYGGIFTLKGKLCRRQTIAELIRKRADQVRRNENSIRNPGFTDPGAKTIQPDGSVS